MSARAGDKNLVKAKKYDTIVKAVGDIENAVIISGEKHGKFIEATQKLEAIRKIDNDYKVGNIGVTKFFKFLREVLGE